MNILRTRKHLPCDEIPDNCHFASRCYRQGETFVTTDKGMNHIIFCREGRNSNVRILISSHFLQMYVII